MNDFKCVALRAQQTSASFFVAVVNAHDLDSICRPLQRGGESGLFDRDNSEPTSLSDFQITELVKSLESPRFQKRSADLLGEERAQPYQRFLDEKRSVEIARYLEQPSALLPNSIILAVNINYDESDVLSSESRGLYSITLPRNQNAAVILDGQHRVAALRYLSPSVRENYQVAVTFLIGIPFYQQAEIFATINGKQKAVNKSIIYDLFGYAPLGGRQEERLYEGLMAIARFCSHVTRILNTVNESPWKNKIKMRGPGDEGIISQAAVVQYMSTLVEPKAFSKRLKTFPLLYIFFKNADPATCASVIIIYLRAIEKALPESWKNARSLLWKNNGVAVIFRILHDEIILAGGAVELIDGFRKIADRWRRASLSVLDNPPKSGGGGIQNQLYDRLKTDLFTKEELNRLELDRDGLKQKLIKMGGLIA